MKELKNSIKEYELQEFSRNPQDINLVDICRLVCWVCDNWYNNSKLNLEIALLKSKDINDGGAAQ